jgi:hypothetical protein
MVQRRSKLFAGFRVALAQALWRQWIAIELTKFRNQGWREGICLHPAYGGRQSWGRKLLVLVSFQFRPILIQLS